MTGDVYVAALAVGEIFADPTYQRLLDAARARKMADVWDRRLAGILEVSDRGATAAPRYAVLDGQHRWAAAKLLQTPPNLVANVHSGLSLADEAALFDKLNRQRKQITTWDHWRARRAAGDELILGIETAVTGAGLRVSEQSGTEGSVWCIGTLEKIATAAGGLPLLAATLTLLASAWGRQRAAYEAPMVHGAAMVLDTFGERLDANRLVDALGEVAPKRIRVTASTMRDTGMPGSLAKLSAVAIVNQYNQKAGKRLAWPNSWRGVLATRRPTVTPKAVAAPAARHTPPVAADATSLTVVGGTAHTLTVPNALPPTDSDFDQYADAVEQMNAQPVAAIAQALGISERTVRRIRSDLGLGG